MGRRHESAPDGGVRGARRTRRSRPIEGGGGTPGPPTPAFVRGSLQFLLHAGDSSHTLVRQRSSGCARSPGGFACWTDLHDARRRGVSRLARFQGRARRPHGTDGGAPPRRRDLARLTARSSVADQSTLLIPPEWPSRGRESRWGSHDDDGGRGGLPGRGSVGRQRLARSVDLQQSDLRRPSCARAARRSARGRRGRGSRARRVAWGARQLFDRGPGRRRRSARVGVRVGFEVGQPVRRARGAAASARALRSTPWSPTSFPRRLDESPFSSEIADGTARWVRSVYVGPGCRAGRPSNLGVRIGREGWRGGSIVQPSPRCCWSSISAERSSGSVRPVLSSVTSRLAADNHRDRELVN